MKGLLVKNIGYIIVIIVLLTFFALSHVAIKGWQTKIIDIVFDGALLLIGTLISKNAMMTQGIIKGKESETYNSTAKQYLQQKEKIYPKLPYLQDWLDYKYTQSMKKQRTDLLYTAGYTYDDVFDKEGKFNNDFVIIPPKFKKYTKWYQTIIKPVLMYFSWRYSYEWQIYREKKRIVNRAKKYKITHLTTQHLLNCNTTNDPYDLGVTSNVLVKNYNKHTILFYLFFSILLQLVVFEFYGFNILSIIVEMLSAITILINSLWAMLKGYTFVVVNDRNRMLNQINMLEEFDNIDVEKIGVVAHQPASKSETKMCTTATQTKQIIPLKEVKNALYSTLPIRRKGDMV